MRELVELAASRGKCIFNRDLDMFVSRVVGWRMVNYDVFVRRKRQPDMDRKPSAVTVLLTRRDPGNPASNEVMIVLL